MTWRAQRDLFPKQGFPVHIIHFISNYFDYQYLYDIRNDLAVSSCLKILRGQFHMMYLETLLAVDYRKAGVPTRKPLVRHAHPGRGNLYKKSFERWTSVCYHYRSLVYTYLSPQKHGMRSNGRQIMEVTRLMLSEVGEETV